MAYTVLARRYRSGTFDELIGQQHVAQTLKNAITSNRLAHAFLFCGTRGTGKTSSARILAKCLNCESSDKPTPNPCGKCYSCQAIARGDDIDVIEIDAASNTGVDNVREIIENSQFRPARSRFKIYIIDEVHMLSKSAFNALLKTLEEPPEHVKFILATTEAEKVLPTILSRCQRYDFRNIPTREIAAHLKTICAQEKIQADDAAILLVAKAGAGSMRDALSLLDRLLSAVGENLTVDSIEQLLGLPRSQQIFELVQAIGRGDVKAVLTQVDVLITSGLSPETLTASLTDHLRNLLILNTCGPTSDLVEVPGLPLEDLAAQAGRFNAIALSQDIVILEELRRQLRTSGAGRALVDATMVRLTLAEQFSTIDGLMSAIETADLGGSAEKKKSELTGPPQAATAPEPEPEPARPNAAASVAAAAGSSSITPSAGAAPEPIAREEPANIEPVSEVDDLPAVGKVWEGAGPTSIFAAFKKSAAPKPAPAPPPNVATSNVGPVDRNDFDTLLQRLRGAAMESQPTVAGFLDGGRIVAMDGGTVTLEYPKALEVSARMLERNGKRESLQQVLSDLLGKPTGIRLSINPDAVVAPPPARAVAAPARPASNGHAAPPPPPPPDPQQNGIPLTEELRVELLQHNPLIKSLAEQFNARIVKVEEA
ncbi:MAG: DNA polymerase III subunit gamma/tau [Tepidisphaeraceae bacterium]